MMSEKQLSSKYKIWGGNLPTLHHQKLQFVDGKLEEIF
jgi:hypothetical protein